MAKPNYAFAKRQRELAKKQKLEEKRLRKAAGGAGGDAPVDGSPADGGPPDAGEIGTGAESTGAAPAQQGTGDRS